MVDKKRKWLKSYLCVWRVIIGDWRRLVTLISSKLVRWRHLDCGIRDNVTSSSESWSGLLKPVVLLSAAGLSSSPVVDGVSFSSSKSKRNRKHRCQIRSTCAERCSVLVLLKAFRHSTLQWFTGPFGCCFCCVTQSHLPKATTQNVNH